MKYIYVTIWSKALHFATEAQVFIRVGMFGVGKLSLMRDLSLNVVKK